MLLVLGLVVPRVFNAYREMTRSGDFIGVFGPVQQPKQVGPFWLIHPDLQPEGGLSPQQRAATKAIELGFRPGSRRKGPMREAPALLLLRDGGALLLLERRNGWGRVWQPGLGEAVVELADLEPRFAGELRPLEGPTAPESTNHEGNAPPAPPSPLPETDQ